MLLRVTLLVSLFVSFAVTGFTAQDPQQVVRDEVGEKGTLEFNSIDFPNELIVWPTADCGEKVCGSTFSAEVRPTTQITFRNRMISRENLDLLNGKTVLAYGLRETVGHGEGGKQYWLRLDLYVLPQEKDTR